MHRSSRIFVAGGSTLIGRGLIEHLGARGFDRLVGVPPEEPDLTAAGQVEDFFADSRPEYVFMAGGKSGGIRANLLQPAELMLDNLLATSHILRAAHEHGVKKLLYLASSCSYPRDAMQPMQVESLMTGLLEPSSAAYATAKLAGIELCRAYQRQHGAQFLVGIPANSFGPHDDFDAQSGHVIAALLHRLHVAQQAGADSLVVWGTGKPRREFLYVRDLADACLFAMERYEGTVPLNLGGGTDVSIGEVARLLAEVVGFRGRLVFDPALPDGVPLKCLDSGPLQQLGWRPQITFAHALEETYAWYLRNIVMEDTVHDRAAV